MKSSKELILNRIQDALKDIGEKRFELEGTIDRSYQTESGLPEKEKTTLFAERVQDYKAKVTVLKKNELADAIRESCRLEKVRNLLVPNEVPEEWIPRDVKILRDEPDRLSYDELDASDGALTLCAVAIANTGTIVLDSGKGQGRRALTLLPDYHICIVQANQIAGNVPEAFRKLEKKVIESGPPITFISGPSATSDIELNRVEGVHGPRRLEVLIVVE